MKCIKCNAEMKCTDDSGSLATEYQSWERFDCQNKECDAKLDLTINGTKVTMDWDLGIPIKAYSIR